MTTGKLAYLGTLGGSVLIAACTGTGTIKEVQSLDGGKVMLTSADVRVISQVKPHQSSQAGVVQPRYITCAEPSPDVAKAIAETSNVGIAASAQLPQGVTPEVAAAIAKARAESMTALGERLATISLLRDALYRACEAYANGALSSTSYAILLSRYDDTMTSLHNSEMAAGAFGRSLAGASGEASAKASATLDTKFALKEHSEMLSELTESVKQSSDVESSLKQVETRRSELKEQREEVEPLIAELESERAAAIESGASAQQADIERRLALQRESLEQIDSQLDQMENTKSSLETALEQTERAVQTTERNLEKQFASTAEGAARTAIVAGGGIEPGKQTEAIARVLSEMQEAYLENINADATDVACVVALDRKATDLTALGEYCWDHNVLSESFKAKADTLKRLFDLKEKELSLRAGARRLSDSSVKTATTSKALSTETIEWVQTALNKIEAAGLQVTGVIGDETEKAIRDFQTKNGLAVDGIAGPVTRAKLREKL